MVSAEPVVSSWSDYYAFGWEMPGRTSVSSPEYRYAFNGKEKDSEWGGSAVYDYGFRIYDSRLGKFLSIDPLSPDYPWFTPYQYAGNKPIRYIDLDGLEEADPQQIAADNTGETQLQTANYEVYVFDQETRPADNGTTGASYTANLYVVSPDGTVNGPYAGSSYPNSISNSNNSTNHNTLNEGTHNFSNAIGHSGGSKQGLNVGQGNVQVQSQRTAPGTNANGQAVTMEWVNVHEGFSNNGNCNSRGSEGCITIAPDDAFDFFSNFPWSADDANTGDITGSITVSRAGANQTVDGYNQQQADAQPAEQANANNSENTELILPDLPAVAPVDNVAVPVFIPVSQ